MRSTNLIVYVVIIEKTRKVETYIEQQYYKTKRILFSYLNEIKEVQIEGLPRSNEWSIVSVKETDQIRNTGLKWNWADDICRMHPEKWAYVTNQWVPQTVVGDAAGRGVNGRMTLTRS